jgi:type VI secretion system protein ImpA
MTSPSQFGVEALLQSIPRDQAAAPGLDRESVQSVFRDILRERIDAPEGRDRSVELGRLIDLGSTYLAQKSKDLVVAAWMVEALTLLTGFAGLRDGLKLMHGLITQFWDECHPRPLPDGDLELRARPFESLNSERSLVLALRRLPLAEPLVGTDLFSHLDISRGRSGRGSAPTEEDFSTGSIGETVSRSSRGFYERLANELREAGTAAEQLTKELRQRFLGSAPDLRALGSTIKAIQGSLDVILAVKRRQEPDEATPEAATVLEGASGSALTRIASEDSATRRSGLDYGLALIDFADRAQSLAKDAEKLKQNRKDYEDHKSAMSKLDDEYQEIVNRIASDEDFRRLLATKLGRAMRPAPPEN